MSLEQALEAILFVADRPANLKTLAEVTGEEPERVEAALKSIQAKLENGSALQLIEIAGGYQFSTREAQADVVTRFLQPSKERFGRSLMEVLAIVAYRQPVTLAEINSIRGVHSDYGLRQLLERQLIREIGRKNAPGRPVIYGTTQQFLHQFRMNDLDELPALTVEMELDQDQLALPVLSQP